MHVGLRDVQEGESSESAGGSNSSGEMRGECGQRSVSLRVYMLRLRLCLLLASPQRLALASAGRDGRPLRRGGLLRAGLQQRPERCRTCSACRIMRGPARRGGVPGDGSGRSGDGRGNGDGDTSGHSVLGAPQRRRTPGRRRRCAFAGTTVETVGRTAVSARLADPSSAAWCAAWHCTRPHGRTAARPNGCTAERRA